MLLLKTIMKCDKVKKKLSKKSDYTKIKVCMYIY